MWLYCRLMIMMFINMCKLNVRQCTYGVWNVGDQQ